MKITIAESSQNKESRRVVFEATFSLEIVGDIDMSVALRSYNTDFNFNKYYAQRAGRSCQRHQIEKERSRRPYMNHDALLTLS